MCDIESDKAQPRRGHAGKMSQAPGVANGIPT
jgi:hypothetical protein